MSIVETWDRNPPSGRLGAGEIRPGGRRAQSEEGTVTCSNADEIVPLMRTWKAALPDVEVGEWQPVGSSVLARLRQPGWGDDADWFQALTVEDGLITRLDDHPDRETAIAAIEGRGA